MNDFQNIKQELFEYSKSLKIIDTHEHFCSEREHVKRYLSFFDYLAAYVKSDLACSGANWGKLNYPQNEEQAIALFQEIKPYWQYVKYGSFARPVLLALEKFHDCDDLTEQTIIKIGRELNERNKPGHYDEIFNKTNIEKIINQSSEEAPFPDSRFCYGIPWEFDYTTKLREFLKQYPHGSYEEYIAVYENEMAEEVANGAKLKKFFADVFITQPNETIALTDFENMRNNPDVLCSNTLSATIAHKTLDLCEKYRIVAAIHTGVWGDITRLSPSILFSVVGSHWNTTFDIYHMGIPYVRECAFLGKNYPRAYLNLCWSHCVSEQMTKSTINEWLDLVPVNKIFGFGGDVNTLPEQIYGQLINALENISAAFAYRIQIGRMDMDYAKYVMKLWLYDNPKHAYKL